MSGIASNTARGLTRADSGGVATLTLCRPEQHNTLSGAIVAALQAEFDVIAADPGIRCVILRAEGKIFCPGHDIKEIQEHRNDADQGRAYYKKLFDASSRLMLTINTLPQPVIAEVGGMAVAAGAQLVASCDLAVASSDARFGLNGIDIGFFCSTPMVPVSRNMPRKKVFELLTTGRLMDAQEACEAGLINKVVAPQDLREVALALALQIASKAASVIALGKRAFYTQARLPAHEAYARMVEVMAENLMMEDAREGFAAFIDKRKPRWQNR